MQLEPRDLAKIGLLVLLGGSWEGKQLVPRDWIEWSTTANTKYGGNDFYGFGWWSRASAPPGFYEGSGRGGQRLSIWPEKDIVVVINAGGADPGKIAPFLFRAFEADTVLPPDSVGSLRLQELLHASTQPPPASPPAPVPACAQQISGRTYEVGANSLGLRTFTLTFSDSLARATLGLPDRTIPLNVGLDGRFRLASVPIDGILPGARGSWHLPCQFILELDLIGKIDHYTVSIGFEGQRARVSVVERTGLLNESVEAYLK